MTGYGRVSAERAEASDDHRELVIVVRNTNRWDGDGNKQHYALAVALERDPWYSALYAEFKAQFELLAEAEIELQ
ncbi:MAG: hypothetical protein ACRDTE_33310 [Pseudonocardiaceae bacterium]